MEKRIVECVPNFSEGRDKAVIDAITAAIVQSGGVKLLQHGQHLPGQCGSPVLR